MPNFIPDQNCPESNRLAEDETRKKNWKRWGPYLSERQWGTVREDYSKDGNCWDYFSHDQSRSRAYRWGEDGLLGITDRECRLCFAPALWNGVDGILKERLFGLTNGQGNHGEDVKEAYFYLDSTPTHSYLKALYKYPQRGYPYADLVESNKHRTKLQPEYEITDTTAFEENRYFDVLVEYAKGDANDILIQISVTNRGPETAKFHLIPTLWFRNTWSWGRMTEDTPIRPNLHLVQPGHIHVDHATLGKYYFLLDPANSGTFKQLLFTENETNNQRLFGSPNGSPFVKDAFHEAVIHGKFSAVNPVHYGTKVGAHYEIDLASNCTYTWRQRLVDRSEAPAVEQAFGQNFTEILDTRRNEADYFYNSRLPYPPQSEPYRVMRQAQAGLLWSKQFYYYEVTRWLKGDPSQPAPDPERVTNGRNTEWSHLFNRDVLSMPDKWEYPWFAAWDLAFHTVEIARFDPVFAKSQLMLLVREWYMHPNGQIPAYEFAFSDVNPPVHAWAAWRVYKITGKKGFRDTYFLESVFQKLLLNFTWWVNRKDSAGRNLFSGGFLGLDNIGVFDRSKPLGEGVFLEQADGTAWMAFYCLTMLDIAMELAQVNPVYEDIASKFIEHFVTITNAVNTFGGTGLWNAEDGFYYDHVSTPHGQIPLKVRSIVGLMPMIAVQVTQAAMVDRLPNFRKRLTWFLHNRPEIATHISEINDLYSGVNSSRMLAIPSRDQLVRMLRYLLDENEFLSPHGIRALSKMHEKHPYSLKWEGQDLTVDYVPGDSTTGLFGGNSNWRGPIWFPINHLIIESIERYGYFYGDSLKVECPTGSGNFIDLHAVAFELKRRLASIFLPNEQGVRPYAQSLGKYGNDPLWTDHLMFHEYFHGDSGSGVGANHQTGWTSLVADCFRDLAKKK